MADMTKLPAGQSKAEQMFWRLPEIMEILLTFLDFKSTVQLAKAQKSVTNIIQGTRVWRNMVKKNSPVTNKRKIKNLVSILKLMTDPKADMLHLLHTICEENPPLYDHESVQIYCPQHLGPHSISWRGFIYLEKVEAALGTTGKTVEAITMDSSHKSDNKLAYLASRMSRQQRQLTSFNVRRIDVFSIENARNFSVLMNSSPVKNTRLEVLHVGDTKGTKWENFGALGWELVAEGLLFHPGVLRQVVFQRGRHGTQEDMRVLWEALRPQGCFVMWQRERGRGNLYSEERFSKQIGEAEWIRLCDICHPAEPSYIMLLRDSMPTLDQPFWLGMPVRKRKGKG